MADVIDKKLALRRYFPRPFYQLKEQGGDGLEIIIDAVGDELNVAAAEIGNARKQYLLATAEGAYLQVHAVDRDIVKPRGFAMSDAVFRELIKIVSNSPKNIEQIFERLIDLFFGPTARPDMVDAYSYRKNEIILRINSGATAMASHRGLLGTTYLKIDSASAYDGLPSVPWATTLAAPINPGDTTATLTSAVGVPAAGMAEIGAGPLVKNFTRVGVVLTFKSPVLAAFPSGTAVTGPQEPDNYPGGYVFDAERRFALIQSILAGSTVVQVALPPPGFPAHGAVYIGDPDGPTFEVIGYTFATGPNRLIFDTPTAFAHLAGEYATQPTMLGSIKTTLGQTILAGTSLGGPGELTVANSALFPAEARGLKLDNGGMAAEVIPFYSRKLGDPTKVLIDPNYVFDRDHAIGERVNIMSRATAPRTSGYDYPFFLDDTEALRDSAIAFLRRVKVTGCKLIVQLI